MLSRSALSVIVLAVLSACGTPASHDSGCPDAAGEPAATYRVRGLSLALVGDGGVALAYGRYCDNCGDVPAYEVRAIDPTVEKLSGAVTNPLYEESGHGGENPLFEGRNDRLIAGGGGAGGTAVFVVDTATEPVMLVGGAIPGGSVISAAMRVSAAGYSRQTPSTSFGSMVRSSQLLVGDDGSARILLGADGGVAIAQLGKDGALSRADSPVPPSSSSAALAFGHGNWAYAWAEGPASQDSLVQVMSATGTTLTAPMKGVPAALWTDGTGFRVAVKHADSIAALWDGKTELTLPRSDETACTAIAFDEAGQAAFLHAGPKSTVLYLQRGTTLEPHVLSKRENSTPDVFGCALAVRDGRVHLAFVLDDQSIEYDQVSAATVSNVLKTRHDTVKNSIGNIR